MRSAQAIYGAWLRSHRGDKNQVLLENIVAYEPRTLVSNAEEITQVYTPYSYPLSSDSVNEHATAVMIDS